MFKNLGKIPLFQMIFLALIPGGTAIFLILSGLVYQSEYRWAVYEGTWCLWGLVFILTSKLAGVSLIGQFKQLQFMYRIGIAAILFWAGFVSLVFAVDTSWSLYIVITALVALCVALSAKGMIEKYGSNYAFLVSLSIIAGMLIHLFPLVMFHILEFRNSDLRWPSIGAPGFTNIRHYNVSIEVALLLCICLFSDKNFARMHSLAAFVFTSACWTVLFWFNARGAILTVGLVFVILPIVLSDLRGRVLLMLIGSAIAGIFCALYIPNTENMFGINHVVNRTLNTSSLDAISSNRVSLWQGVLDHIKLNPIFGYGLGHVGLYLGPILGKEYAILMHAHNVFLDTIFSLGIFAAVLVFYLFIKMWIASISVARSSPNPIRLGAFVGVTALIVHGMLSGTYFFVHSRIIFALLVAIVFAMPKAKSKPE